MKTDSTQNDIKENPSDNSESNDVINLVKSIFKKVEQDEAITLNIRQFLAKLYKPYLKFAQDTPNLFAIENHQARVFLTSILKVSKEWKQENDLNSTFIKKIESIVNKIVVLENYDNRVFIKSASDIEKQMSRINKRLSIKLKRKKETQLGQDKIYQAKQNTKNILVQKLKGKKIPKHIKELLLSEWFNVLVLLNIRHSLDSEEYLKKSAFVDHLINYTQLNSDNKINEKQLKNIAKEYQEGLKLVAFNPIECENKQKDLLNLLIKINQLAVINPEIKPKKAPLVKISKPIAKTISKNQKLDKNKPMPVNVKKGISQQVINKPKPSQLNQKEKNTDKNIKPQDHQEKKNIDYTNIVSKIKKGTWFIFLDSQKNQVKAKLSWISPISEKYLFVDANGLKLTDTTKTDLIEGLNNKSIQVLKSF